METFALNLSAKRKAENLTQSDLGEKIGRTKQVISHWESGRVEPSLTDLVKLSVALNVSVDELVTGKNILYQVAEKDTKAESFIRIIQDLSSQVNFLSKELGKPSGDPFALLAAGGVFFAPGQSPTRIHPAPVAA